MLDKFAEELKEARRKSELSLQQVAGKTRIDLKFLENMENGNFTFLPDLYVKAFIKEYSKVVGLDEDEMIDKYESAIRGKPIGKKEVPESKPEEPTGEKEEETKKETGEKEEEQEIKEKPQPKTFSSESISSLGGGTRFSQNPISKLSKNTKIILAIVGGIIVLFLIIYFGFIHNSSRQIVNEKSYEQIRNENNKRYEKEKNAKNGNTKTEASTDSLSLLIQARDTSWVKIMMDGKDVKEFILFPKSSKELKARNNFEMILGNSGAMSFKLDNKPLKFKGKHKQVEYVAIDSLGVKYLHSPPNFNQ